jgi:hypothetical protein
VGRMNPPQAPISVLHRAISKRWAPFSATLSFSGRQSGVAHGQPRARVPYLVGSRLPSPYHFRARIQSFQAVAAPFPGDSFFPRQRRNASVQKIGDRLDDLRRGGDARTNVERRRNFGKKFVERLGGYPTFFDSKPFLASPSQGIHHTFNQLQDPDRKSQVSEFLTSQPGKKSRAPSAAELKNTLVRFFNLVSFPRKRESRAPARAAKSGCPLSRA